MKLILNIAKNELKMLFCSPIAWFILIIFAFQSGFTFSTLFNEQVQAMDAGDSLFALSSKIYTSGYQGFLSKVLGYLYLYFPILTMGIMSREFANGSVKLLYASPIKNIHIVLGKYLA